MPNSLAQATSPYLQQHAENPVDWLEWSAEVFERAEREDKLVFLSIGYSTCHWCHVMERESFESEQVAAYLNEHYLSVKVDREERPDLDATYMAYVQAVTGGGGWPMTVILTPERKPIFGGTYFPPLDRDGRAGFMTILREIQRLWQDDRGKIVSSADKAVAHLQRQATPETGTDLPPVSVLDQGREDLTAAFDVDCGGFGGAPKFPRPVLLRFLAAEMARLRGLGEEDETVESLQALLSGTLDPMAGGGLHDHLGGGFHRYSVDRYWHVPHFEKMLYDQAQLMDAYTEAWQWSGEERYQAVVEGIASYVTGSMRDEWGAFHAAEDADSRLNETSKEKQEGAYWTWSVAELEAAIEDPLDLQLAAARFAIEADGNAAPESDPHGELRGRNTLYLAASVVDLAEQFGLGVEDAAERLNRASGQMAAYRAKKPMPHRDDKIVAAWNGMMIAALARAARAFGRGDWLVAAKVAADFVLNRMWDGEALVRTWRDGKSGPSAFPLDYACLIDACLQLAGTDASEDWLGYAGKLQAVLDRDFWSDEFGAYLTAVPGARDTLYPLKEDYDGAEPSPNSQSALNLLALAILTGKQSYREKAGQLIVSASPVLRRNPTAAPLMLLALGQYRGGLERFEWQGDLCATLHRRAMSGFHPRAMWLAADGTGGAKVRICDQQACRAEIEKIEQWAEQLGASSGS